MPEVHADARSGGVFQGWFVLAAAFVGLVFGATSILIYSVGVFTRPLEAEFGWTRGQISLATTIVLYVAALSNPAMGWLVDRFGARRIILVSIPAFGAAVASLFFLPASLQAFYFAWGAIAVCSIALWSGPYNKIVAQWFDKRLGLALGIVAAGQGIGATLLPTISQYLIGEFGWRLAWVGLGALTVAISFTLNLAMLAERPADPGPAANANALPVAQSGLTLREAARERTFWTAIAAYFAVGIMTGGITNHQVPMLVDAGLTPQGAALVASSLGLGLTAGRLIVGWLLDRFHAPFVMIGALCGPLAGISLYAAGFAGNQAYIFAFLIGFGIGAEVDVLGYIIPRYFGRRAYGKIYAFILSAFEFGAGAGAAMVGAIRTARGSYTSGFALLVIAALVSMALFASLGPYRREKPAA